MTRRGSWKANYHEFADPGLLVLEQIGWQSTEVASVGSATPERGSPIPGHHQLGGKVKGTSIRGV